jgi:hypothetical protein
MSYFLSFWKQTSECRRSPKQIEDLLLEDPKRQALDGLEPLDTWRIAARFSEFFPEIVDNRFSKSTELAQSEWESQDGTRSFVIDWYSLHFGIQCCTATTDELNRAIDVAIEFGCRLFDPQTGIRYEGQ